MSNKTTVAIIALCVGVILGWAMCFYLVPRGVSQKENGLSSLFETGRNTRSPVASSSQGSGDILAAVDSESSEGVPASNNEDEQEDRTERMGIIMQQSATEVRQAIIDNAGLDESQIEQLDKAIDDMNRQMLEVSTKWADTIRETGTLDMDMRLRMQYDINGVSVEFSDRMDAEFPGWRGKDTDLSRLVRVTTAFEPFRKVRSEILRGEMNANRPQQ